MDYNELLALIENNGDSEQALKMSAYMRNQFQFLGLPAPKRKALCKDFFELAKNSACVDWAFVRACWAKPCREFRYMALDYLSLMQKHLTPGDIPAIKKLATDAPWWDTIDGLDRIVGCVALEYPQVNAILLEWSTDENFWLRRIAIDHQLLRKEKTDTALLERIIVNNLGQSEFFINKAIGWALRDYSKTNPDWVRAFIDRCKDGLAPLSIKEASKYI